MNVLNKSPDAFRTISEVAQELDLPQHVLRFWETRFSQIKPMKRGGGRRYYRPDDVELLRGIKHLLYGEGYTIKGVQRILKEQGVRHVILSVHGGEDDAEATGPMIPPHMDAALHATEPSQLEVARPPLVVPPAHVESAPTANGNIGQTASARVMAQTQQEAQLLAVAVPTHERPSPPALDANSVVAHAAAQPHQPLIQPPIETTGPVTPAVRQPTVSDAGAVAAPEQMIPAPTRLEPATPAHVAHTPIASEQAAADHSPSAPSNGNLGGIFSRLKNEKPDEQDAVRGGPAHMPKDDVRRLQSTLFELLECKRILDRARG